MFWKLFMHFINILNNQTKHHTFVRNDTSLTLQQNFFTTSYPHPITYHPSTITTTPHPYTHYSLNLMVLYVLRITLSTTLAPPVDHNNTLWWYIYTRTSWRSKCSDDEGWGGGLYLGVGGVRGLFVESQSCRFLRKILLFLSISKIEKKNHTETLPFLYYFMASCT